MQTLSIILPVYNEAETIETVLKEWQIMLKTHKISFSFIICEDGSTDGTKDLLLKLRKKYPLILNQKEDRRGYGGAVIDGILSSDSEYVLCIDSDGQCDPRDFKKFWVQKNIYQTDILIGWRIKRADPVQRKLFSSLFKAAFTILFPTDIHDPSAPFVLFKKTTIQPYLSYLHYLKEGFWWGFVGMCVKKKLTIHELPINHRKRLKGDSQVYKPEKILGISVRNFFGLLKLRFIQ